MQDDDKHKEERSEGDQVSAEGHRKYENLVCKRASTEKRCQTHPPPSPPVANIEVLRISVQV